MSQIAAKIGISLALAGVASIPVDKSRPEAVTVAQSIPSAATGIEQPVKQPVPISNVELWDNETTDIPGLFLPVGIADWSDY